MTTLTFVSPVRVPGVSHKPVGGTILRAPAQDSDCVSTQCFITVPLVNTAFVAGEVCVNSEVRLHRSILEDFGFDLLLVSGDRVDLLSEVLVLAVGLLVTLAAGVKAFRCWLDSLARRKLALGVVFARREVVRLATVVSAVQAPRHKASFLVVLPSRRRETAFAPVSAGTAASQQVFSRDVDLNLALGVNADSVGDGFHRSKCLQEGYESMRKYSLR